MVVTGTLSPSPLDSIAFDLKERRRSIGAFGYKCAYVRTCLYAVERWWCLVHQGGIELRWVAKCSGRDG